MTVIFGPVSPPPRELFPSSPQGSELMTHRILSEHFRVLRSFELVSLVYNKWRWMPGSLSLTPAWGPRHWSWAAELRPWTPLSPNPLDSHFHSQNKLGPKPQRTLTEPVQPPGPCQSLGGGSLQQRKLSSPRVTAWATAQS